MEFRINRLAIGAQGDDGWIQRKVAKPRRRKDAKSGWNDSCDFALIFMQRGTVNTLRKNVTLVVKRIKTAGSTVTTKKNPCRAFGRDFSWLPSQLRLFDTAKLSNGDAENLKTVNRLPRSINSSVLALIRLAGSGFWLVCSLPQVKVVTSSLATILRCSVVSLY